MSNIPVITGTVVMLNAENETKRRCHRDFLFGHLRGALKLPYSLMLDAWQNKIRRSSKEQSSMHLQGAALVSSTDVVQHTSNEGLSVKALYTIPYDWPIDLWLDFAVSLACSPTLPLPPSLRPPHDSTRCTLNLTERKTGVGLMTGLLL